MLKQVQCTQVVWHDVQIVCIARTLACLVESHWMQLIQYHAQIVHIYIYIYTLYIIHKHMLMYIYTLYIYIYVYTMYK